MTITDTDLDTTWHHAGARATAELLKLGEYVMPVEWTAERCRAETLRRLDAWATLPHVRDGVRSYL